MILSAEALQFSKDHEHINVHELALQASKFPEIDIPQALQQIKGLQVAKSKLPSWYRFDNVIYPVQLSLEQCSSEDTALYKQSLCDISKVMVDLTGGFGIDISFLSKNFSKVIYVEQQESLVELAKHNFSVLGLHNIEVVNADAVDYLSKIDAVDMIYIDPARRDVKGRKTVSIEDCTPNLLDIQSMLDSKAERVMIKLSPMLDISLALKSLTNISEVHIVSVHNECKELLFIKEQNFRGVEPILHCINIMSTSDCFSFSRTEEENTLADYTSSLNRYLYEPNASLMKAGAYKVVCDRYNVKKLHLSSHLYTSDLIINDFPGRKFKILTVSSLNKKDIKRDFSIIKQANIATRNFPLKAEELRKLLNLKDGGNIYIFGTTLSDNQKVLLICEKL